MEHDSPTLLFQLACDYLRSERVVRPGAVVLLEHVAAARERARAETWLRVAHLVGEHGAGAIRRSELEALLVVDPVLGRTPMRWLEAGPTTASPAAVKAELEKLAYLRRMDAHTLDLSMLPAERRRFLGTWRSGRPEPTARPRGACSRGGTGIREKWAVRPVPAGQGGLL
jgi:hypothetical protein